MRGRHFLYYFFLLLLQIPASGQYTINRFRQISTENGLSDNLVNSLVQDDKGYIWIGTSNGLNRFDGHQFDTYRSASGLTGSSNIRLLKKFSGNRIGVLSSKGFSVINASDVSGTIYTVPDSTTLWFDMNQVFDATELPGGGYLFTGATGIYAVNREGRFLSRYEHFRLADKLSGQQRIFFGNTLFETGAGRFLLYYQDIHIGEYDVNGQRFLPESPAMRNERSPFLVATENWTVKKQVNAAEFLFLSFSNNKFRYYNKQTNQQWEYALPFEAASVFYWDSNISFLNDSVFTVNCHRSGFYLFTLDRKNRRVLTNPALQLPGVECRALMADRNGRLWIATTQGILMEEKMNPNFSWRYTTTNTGNEREYFNTCVFKAGSLVFTGRYGMDNGMLVFNNHGDSLLRQINFFGGHNRYNGVFSISMYYPDTLYVATESGAIWLHSRNFSYGKLQLPGNFDTRGLRFYPLHRDGTAWLLNYNTNELARYNPRTRHLQVFNDSSDAPLPAMKPKFIAYDSYGDVWVGGNGLRRWNHLTGQFDTLIRIFAGRYPLEERVTGMIADNKGNLWLTTVDNGILQYAIAKHRWKAFDERDGLPSRIAGSFSPFIGNCFWFTSTSHLFYLSDTGGQVSVNASDFNLPRKNMTSENNHYYYDSLSDRMYFAVRNILAVFQVGAAIRKQPLPLLLKEVIVNNERHVHFPGDTLELSYRESQVTLVPGIIDFDKSSPWQFAYSLDDGPFTDLPLQQPAIVLDNLQAGTHSIAISVKGASGSTQPIKTWLIVHPPFWKTTWFYLLVVGITTLLLFLLYRLRVGSIRRQALLNQRLAEFEMKALHAQMNPHFIFNCLNSIKGLIINNQNREASQYLNKFSVLVRNNLDHSRSQFITLQENIDYLKHYVDLENYRFGNIRCVFDTSQIEDPEEIHIAPMLLQPLVENAIWHGSQLGGCLIAVSFEPAGDNIICKIEDNGIGIDHSLAGRPGSDRESVGLANIRERISLLNQKFGLDYSLQITDKSTADPPGKGTLVVLQFKSK